MCGRYFFDLDSEELSALYQKIQDQARREEKLAEKIAAGEVYPSNHVVTLIQEDNQVMPTLTRWGFQGFKKSQLMINARSETVEQKKTFVHPFRTTRCIFPMSGFYEWDSNKQKFFFTNNQILYVGGFYRIHPSDSGNEKESIIMTTSPNQSVSEVHDRMPFLVDKKDVSSYLSDLTFARNLIGKAMPELTATLIS